MGNVYIPPIKCQGIKSKLVPIIKANVVLDRGGVWYEPFMGSGVVGFNILPDVGRFSDLNPHIINFHNAVKNNEITHNIVNKFLKEEGGKLKAEGEIHYYFIRDRFNAEHNPLDFLFLSRSCFNGMIRFNKKGEFNVPFCRKPNRFSQAYITKITNQVNRIHRAAQCHDWTFECCAFEKSISKAREGDFIYCDPPYLGRHVDYYDSWTESDEYLLHSILRKTKVKFILSTWHSNRFRKNEMLINLWSGFHVVTKEHFYHVGGREENRNGMLEALVLNFPPLTKEIKSRRTEQMQMFNDKSAGIGF